MVRAQAVTGRRVDCAEPRMKPPRLLRVEWTDPTSHVGWMPLDQVTTCGPTACVSVGFEIDSDDETIRLAQSLAGDSCADVLVIPRVCVQKTKRLV